MKIEVGYRVMFQNNPYWPPEFGVVTSIRSWKPGSQLLFIFVRFDDQPPDAPGKACYEDYLEVVGATS